MRLLDNYLSLADHKSAKNGRLAAQISIFGISYSTFLRILTLCMLGLHGLG